MILSCAVTLAGLLVSGCALTGYGSLRKAQEADNITIEALLENWKDYEIHFTGLSLTHPAAVLFDLRDDEKRLLATRWVKVKDKGTLQYLVENIRTQPTISGYLPGLWVVIGPDSKIYGYLFTPWRHAVLKTVDENTLSVYGISLPPYLEVDWHRPMFDNP